MYVPSRARAIAVGAGATIALAFAPRPLACAVLAATAGTLFEAAPFVVLASLLPARLRGVATLAGCGCGGRGAPPGALAPVAIAVCWLSFGPGIAIARIVAAAFPAVVRALRARDAAAKHAVAAGGDSTTRTSQADLVSPSGRATDAHGHERGSPLVVARRDASPDAHDDATFATLWGLAVTSAATALAMPHIGGLSAEPVLAAVTGLALGTIVPCATAGVAVAASCASRDPWLAAGLLATAGIVPAVYRPRFRGPFRASVTSGPPERSRSADSGRECSLASACGPTRVPPAEAAEPVRVRPAESPAPRGGRFALVFLAVALAALALRGGAGLVNPRLVPLAALAAVAAGARAVIRPRAIQAGRGAAALPAIMLAALVAGSPEPPYVADEVTTPDGFPGEPVTFTGVAHADGAATRIVRFSITCCRLDAAALAITLDRRLAVRDGTWLRVRGRFVLRDGRLAVRSERVAAVPEPTDPYVYR